MCALLLNDAGGGKSRFSCWVERIACSWDIGKHLRIVVILTVSRCLKKSPGMATPGLSTIHPQCGAISSPPAEPAPQQAPQQPAPDARSPARAAPGAPPGA